MNLRDTNITIGGAGIGGAAAALVLANGGGHVTLIERVTEPRAVGAGILLQPNGLAVLYGLGLRERLQSNAHLARTFRIAKRVGSVISEQMTPDFGEGLDHTLVIRRSHLFDALLSAVAAHPNIECRFGTEVVAATVSGAIVHRDTAGEHRLEAGLAIGADGVHSRIRDCGTFGTRDRTGMTYVRGLSAATSVIDVLTEYWTPLGIFGAAPVDAGTYFYSSVQAAPLQAALDAGDLMTFGRLWAAVVPRAAELLAGVPSFDDLLVNQVTRIDCRTFVDGRLILLGDAAHAMAPNLGQGANSALVDAAVLAHELVAAPDIDTALRRYDVRRRPAVKRVQDVADRIGGASGWCNPVARMIRDTGMKVASSVVGDRGVRAAQQEDPAWLYAAVRDLGSLHA